MDGDAPEGKWIVRAYRLGDEMVVPDPEGPDPVLDIAGGQVSGTMGVNRFTGRLEGGIIPVTFSMTRMAGPPGLMEQEDTLLTLLAETDRIEVDGDGMTLSYAGLNLVELQRSDGGETSGIA